MFPLPAQQVTMSATQMPRDKLFNVNCESGLARRNISA